MISISWSYQLFMDQECVKSMRLLPEMLLTQPLNDSGGRVALDRTTQMWMMPGGNRHYQGLEGYVRRCSFLYMSGELGVSRQKGASLWMKTCCWCGLLHVTGEHPPKAVDLTHTVDRLESPRSCSDDRFSALLMHELICCHHTSPYVEVNIMTQHM